MAFVLALLLAWPTPAGAGDTAVLTGRVLPAANGRAIANAVWAGAVPAPVAADGTFRAEGVPAGPTDIAIETSEGLYAVYAPILLAPGATRRVQLAFGGRQDTSAPPPEEKAEKKSKRGVWDNPVTATLIVVGSAIVVGVAVDQLTQSSSTLASPSAP